jgi:LuxR family transcriptional regulator, maltose regulon positive regulatory protein
MRRNSKPLVRNDLLVTDEPNVDPVNPVQVGSQQWYDWLVNEDGFIYEGVAGHFTARRELRRGIGYWYGYRRRDGKLTKIYLGKSEELTQENLKRTSSFLAGQLTLHRLVGDGNSADMITTSNPQSTAIVPSAGGLEDLPFPPLTKIKPPALPQGHIERPYLTQRINKSVTFICAPSGFGKSTVLNEWQRSCGMPVAWVALDADDNNPLRFWATVVMALQTINPSMGQSCLSQLRSSSPSTISNIVVKLTNDIVQVTDTQNAPQWIGLVLDHYHYIQNPEIHTSLQTLLEHIPATLKLVVASLTKPPLALGYLRAKGMVVELGVDDLRFTLEEGIEFLRENTPGQQLAYSNMQTLVKRTGGWITGLVLATHALAQPGDHARSVETFTGSHTLLREYYMENVLYWQPPEVQTFLFKTSILKHLTGSLCDAITGQSGGAKLLAQLWEENIFLERLEQPDWYRYHEMFAEMLRTQLQEQLPTEISRLHRKAAKWYRAHNAPAEAIHHLLLSKSWEKAAALIEDVALSELEKFGEDSRLLRWLQQLPETMIQQHRTLLVVYIQLARLVLPPKEVDDFLSRTEQSIISMPTSKKTSVLLKTLTEIKRIRRLWTADNLAVLGLRTNGEYKVVEQMLNGILHYHRDFRLDLVKAEEKANEVYVTAKTRGHLFSILMAGGACANLAYSQGHLRRSEQVAYKVLQQTTELREKLPGPASIALTALSGVYYERNQITQAHQLLERAVEVDPDPISTTESITMAILRAKIQSIQGDDDAGFATLQAIRESYSHHPSNIWLDQDLIAYQALFRVHQGDLTSAERYLSGGWEIDKHPFSALVRASMLVKQNRNVAAEEILDHLLNQYPNSFYWVPILRVRVMLSVVLYNQKKMNQARQVMLDAARIAAPEFFVRPFITSDPQIAALLSLVLHTENLNPGTRSFIAGTLAILGHNDGTQKTSSRDEPVPLAIAASISPREQQILQSICAGLSNREIAERFSISESTVKTHIENIYHKLGVNSRTQAIGQAQALGLV